TVLAVDINPHAARAARENACRNGFAAQVHGICSNLMSALEPRPLFDVIISNPPFFPGEPRDLADRAWHAGPGYRDIESLFEQVRERLAPGGLFYLLLSSHSDMELLGALIAQARLRTRVADQRSLFLESLVLHELRAQ